MNISALIYCISQEDADEIERLKRSEVNLMSENDKLKRENKSLRAHNAHLTQALYHMQSFSQQLITSAVSMGESVLSTSIENVNYFHRKAPAVYYLLDDVAAECTAEYLRAVEEPSRDEALTITKLNDVDRGELVEETTSDIVHQCSAYRDLVRRSPQEILIRYV